MKRFASFFCVALISVVLVVPVFALSDEQLTSIFVPADGLKFVLSSSYHESWTYVDYSADPGVFVYRNSTNVFAITRTPNAAVTLIRKNAADMVINTYDFVCGQVFYSNPDDPDDVLYWSGGYLMGGYPGDYSPTLEAFNTVVGSTQADVIVATFKQFEDVYVPPTPQSEKTIAVPIGYAAYLKASGTLTLRCTFPSNSNLVSTGHGWWGETRQTLGSADSLPSDSFQPSGVQIVWARDSALSALGVLGTTKHAYSEHAAMSPWTVIVNPVNKYLSLGSDQNTRDSYNGPISVSGTIGEFRLYPLAGSWSPSTGLEDDGSGSEYIDVNIDPETGEPIYTDPDGNVVTPPAPGGSTSLPEAVSSSSLVQRIVGILSDLVNRIEGIFSVAYQAISNLVGLAGPFVAKLSALYSWLPAPVLSALSSAMILAITIGVLKVFL